MIACIITIGDELLIGQVADTNSTWIAAQLNDAGVRVERILTVGDGGAQIRAAFEEALAAADLVVVTGGLGPTKDDITKTVLAEFFGCGMRLDEDTYAHIEAMLAGRGIAFNALNRGQAIVPECCTVLPNPNGTAPGMWFVRGEKILVSLPGVPFEMKGLVRNELLPRLRERMPHSAIVHRTAVLYGIAESVLAERIRDWETALPSSLHLAYLPSPSQMRLRLSSYDTDATQADRDIDHQFGLLRGIVPQFFVGFGDATVQSAVAEILATRGETLSVAESCTGGRISSLFTAMEGASDYFLGGVVSYANSIKTGVLGVDPADIAAHGAVSRQVVEAMAEGVRHLTGSTYSIATSGVAGPSGGTAEKPVGTVWMAVATPAGVASQLASFGKLRQQNIERASASAINLLRVKILNRLIES